MKQFSVKIVMAFSLLLGIFTINACQKESLSPKAITAETPMPVTERSPEHITYGVTVYDGVNPSQIVAIDEGTGAVINAFQAYVDFGSGPVYIDDLKGIARTSWGQFFITTGTGSPTFVLNNALLKVNVAAGIPGLGQGQCSSFNSISPFGPISDLEFDQNTDSFYGLVNNTNQIVQISSSLTNYTNYAVPANITGINAGTTLKGFSIVRDGVGGTYFVGCANRTGNPFTPTSLYRIPLTGGLATFLTSLNPAADLNGGHCGIGFDLDLNHLVVNRVTGTPTTVSGLNELNPWTGAFGPATATAFWGGATYNFEDLSSSIY